MPYRPFNGPLRYRYTFEAGSGDAVQELIVTATSDDEAMERASVEAAMLGLADAPLRCADYEPSDPSGGDGEDD
jgi:hypothetical protein